MLRMTWEVAQEDILYTAMWIVLLAVFDFVVASRTKARWWLCHLFANAFVVILALPDLVTSVLDPTRALEGEIEPYNITVCYVIAAIHLYHMIAFRDLTADDYFHHILFSGVICPAGLIWYSGRIISCLGFFLSGWYFTSVFRPALPLTFLYSPCNLHQVYPVVWTI